MSVNKFFLLIVLSVSAHAQTTFGRMGGAVTDPTGASVAGAKVIIRNTDTQATREIMTDEKGYYSVENLPIGPYRVEVEHPGFKHSTQSGFFNSRAHSIARSNAKFHRVRRKAIIQ